MAAVFLAFVMVSSLLPNIEAMGILGHWRDGPL